MFGLVTTSSANSVSAERGHRKRTKLRVGMLTFSGKKVTSFTQLLLVRNSDQKYLKTQILLEWFGQRIDQLERKIKVSVYNNREMLKLIL